MYRFLVLLTLALPPIVLTHNIGLRFADSTSSYIMIKPDMQPLRKKISICAWVHRKKSSDGPTVMRYNAPSADSEFVIRDSFTTFWMLGKSTFTWLTSGRNQWHHQCITWSFKTRTTRFYKNGQQITSAATQTPPGRKLAMGGSIAIGQSHITTTLKANFEQTYSFGGELFKLNIYSKQLTDEEISEMYESGMCSEFEESLTDEMFLKWNTIVYHTPHHNVEKFSMTQCPSDTHEEPTEHWNILKTAEFYNKEVTSELLDKLGSHWEVLGEFKGHVIDEALIAHLLKHH